SHCDPENTRNKGAVLRALLADANFAGLARCTQHVSSDIDVVVAGGEICTGIEAQSDVAGGVGKKRLRTVGGVLGAGCVATKRIKTGGRILAARCVAFERKSTVGRVVG